MKMAWKEIKKNKLRYLILGSIIFLIALLTLIISGLANGLSKDNASLIQNLPEGTYYLEESADERHTFSSISSSFKETFESEVQDGMLFSIQMGEIVDGDDQSYGIAYTTASNSDYFPDVNPGEIILDRSLHEEELQVGDTVTSAAWDGELIISGFTEHEKYSHSPVGFIHFEDYGEIYQTDDFQIAYTEDNGFEFNNYSSFDESAFLDTIPSYSAEQLSLNMIIIFLYIISGLLFAIFFYMINVQKLGTFGILKAIGIKTSQLFIMMWLQMLMITSAALGTAVIMTQLFDMFAPSNMPFSITGEMLLVTSSLFTLIGLAGVTLSGIQIKQVAPIEAITQGGV